MKKELLRNSQKKKSVKRRILDYSIGGAILLTMGIGILYVIKDALKDRILKDVLKIEVITIQKGDTYSGYAVRLRERYPCIKDAGFDKTIDYVRSLNKRKELIKGRKANLPFYNCPK